MAMDADAMMNKRDEMQNQMAEKRSQIMDKRDQMMADAQKRWTKLTEHDLAEAKGNVQDLISLLQQRYGYTRERAEREVNQFLDQYDAKVYNLARSLPGDVPSKIMHRPWATLATMLGVGVALGFLTRPGCNGAKHVTVDVEASHPADWVSS